MTNYVGQFTQVALNTLNVTARVGLVVVPALKATPYVLGLATKTLEAALPLIGVGVGKDSYYETVTSYMPAQVNLSRRDYAQLAKDAFYNVALATVSLYALNKFVGPAPALYNNAASTLGNFLSGQMNVIQLVLNKISK